MASSIVASRGQSSSRVSGLRSSRHLIDVQTIPIEPSGYDTDQHSAVGQGLDIGVPLRRDRDEQGPDTLGTLGALLSHGLPS